MTGYAGLPMSDADLEKHYEASKCDVVDLVGSEVRQIIGELRYYRASPAQAVAPPGWRCVKRELDDDCGCPEEVWERALSPEVHMHLVAGKASNGHADNGDWEAEIRVTCATIDQARAAILGWATSLSSDAPAALTTPDEQRGEG